MADARLPEQKLASISFFMFHVFNNSHKISGVGAFHCDGMLLIRKKSEMKRARRFERKSARDEDEEATTTNNSEKKN